MNKLLINLAPMDQLIHQGCGYVHISINFILAIAPVIQRIKHLCQG
ncbi:hypothetical protein LC653_30205 [Nostoc sp. CHAB 5784]|nr:hypothetical protein [Nostoc mirabile]MCC5668033.1 hypothetical protein [Nostoc mirabile CHAB5784]